MDKIIIPDFDRNKSYPNIVKPLNKKYIPVYGRKKCSCHYGYNCDDDAFNPDIPIYWEEVEKDDKRTEIIR